MQEDENPKKNVPVSFVVFIIFLVIAIPLVIFGAKKLTASATTPSQTDTGKPEIPITDLGPGVPAQDKTALVIKHSDSSMQEFLVPKTMVSQYTHNLQPGDTIVQTK